MSTTSILIIAHAPLAHALRACALHVFADCADSVAALDILHHQPPEESLAQARIMLDQLGADSTLVLTDLFGATPCTIAPRRVAGVRWRVVAGVNLPMLLRAVSYRCEPLDAVVTRAVAGGA